MNRGYRTLAREICWEIDKIKGSRFIGTAFPIEREEAVSMRVKSLRNNLSEAGHHAWAWRIGERFRYNDDGEPSGTAGRPILQQMDGFDLDRCCVIVSRIFGGTKLGAGGLVRAYGHTAADTLDAADIIRVVHTRTVKVVAAYNLSGVLDGLAAAHGVTPVEQEYGVAIRRTYRVPLADVGGFVSDLQERTAGRVEIEIGPDPTATIGR